MRKTETQKGKINDVLFMYNMHAHTHTHTSLHMQVQKFVILKNDLSIPGGELGERVRRWRKERRERERERKKLIKKRKSQRDYCYFFIGPTLKLKRFFVMSKYSQVIDEMYSE